MNARRVQALVRRVVEEIRRDRPSLALLSIAPILLTGLVTFILREGATPAVHAVIVEDGAPGPLVSALESGLRTNGNTVAQVPDEAAARAAIADGSASVAIVLPADLLGASPPTITVITDGLDPSGEGAQLAAVSKDLLGTVTSAAGAVLPTIVHTTLYGTPTTDQITNFAPAIVGFFAYFFVYLLTGVSFLRERTGGTLERLMATPVRRTEIVAGYTLGFGLFAMIQVALLMTWVLGSVQVPAIGSLPAFSVGLGVAIAGNPLAAFLVVLLLALGAVSLGIFLSTFARTELQIIQFIPLVLAPQFLLSGVLFPVSSLPGIIQPLAPVLPLTYAIDGLRQVFIRGADLSVGALQLDLVVLAAIALFFAVIASLTIRRDVV
ncbi:MAG TPA: ABC transporter permease [Candidatus Sulfotelmatobacter sp.]|nr:ABC transporter permease [Candidatus Sulfotelmatobacter sp.]